MKQIYFDYNATTPVDKRIVDAVIPYFLESFGNPSNSNSPHGREANRAFKKALRTVADYFSVESSDDIILTSGATESNNLLLHSIVDASEQPCRIITTKIEHDSILKTLEAFGDRVVVDFVENDANGLVDLADLERKIRDDTALITIMGANNEIGTIQPIAEIAEIAHRHNVPFHSDATQLIPHQRINLAETEIDYLSLSGHKIYAPKGVGLLICRNDRALSRIRPQIMGGGQQNGYRSGTINVPGAVEIAEAIKLLDAEMEQETAHKQALYDAFFAVLDQQKIPYHLNGDPVNRINGNISIAIDGLTSIRLLAMLPEYSISTGSACSTGKKSHVLAALDCPDSIVSGTIRIGFGRFSEQKEIETLANKIADIYRSVHS
ncbi:MAG: cysteine desulfurase [Oscillospiraceae bacterium]|nr:cysteine desulfurase [Oscillospiraceae bacterium]